MALVASLAAAACGSSSSSNSGSARTAASTSSGGGTLNGAGSTFAAPIYQQWGSSLKSQGVTANYNPVGSGAGVAQLTAGTVVSSILAVSLAENPSTSRRISTARWLAAKC